MANIKVRITLHKFGEKFHRPHRTRFIKWAEATVNYAREQGLPEARSIDDRTLLEINVRLVTEEEMRHLNAKHRRKASLTTVLSFPCEDSAPLGLPDFGDIVMCGKAIVAEAAESHLDIDVHWGHLFYSFCSTSSWFQARQDNGTGPRMQSCLSVISPLSTHNSP